MKKGDVVGKIIIKNGNKIVKEEKAIINEDIEKMGFLQTLGKTLKDIITGEIF